MELYIRYCIDGSKMEFDRHVYSVEQLRDFMNEVREKRLFILYIIDNSNC